MQLKTANIKIAEAVLVEQCRQGDSAAMELLIFKYQGRVYNVILKICGNPDDAAELTQETFVKAIENIEKFEARSSFYTWVFRIAVNLTLTHRQRRLKLAFSSLDAGDNENHEQAKVVLKEFLCDANSPNPAVIAQSNELCELIVKTLMKLDESQRAVAVLHDIEGFTYAQIAKVLNIKLGTVKSRLSRARTNLRERLQTICFSEA